MINWITAGRIARRHKLKERGIVYPKTTVREAREAGIELSLALALLEQESSGGHNVFGHDPVQSVVGGNVTKRRYLRYKERRKKGLGMQGVGPMQLTWWKYQDEADALGGAWRPSINMRVGFKLVKQLIKTHGELGGIAAYNGSGEAATKYAKSVLAKKAAWEARIAKDNHGA